MAGSWGRARGALALLARDPAVLALPLASAVLASVLWVGGMGWATFRAAPALDGWIRSVWFLLAFAVLLVAHLALRAFLLGGVAASALARLRGGAGGLRVALRAMARHAGALGEFALRDALRRARRRWGDWPVRTLLALPLVAAEGRGADEAIHESARRVERMGGAAWAERYEARAAFTGLRVGVIALGFLVLLLTGAALADARGNVQLGRLEGLLLLGWPVAALLLVGAMHAAADGALAAQALADEERVTR